MALDATAREANLWDSIKKYFIDNITTVPLLFDRSLAEPYVKEMSTDKWYSFILGPTDISALSDITLYIYCCTRSDNEYHKLSQLVDNMRELLTDNTMTDGMKRIPFYQHYPPGTWTVIGYFQVQEMYDSTRMTAADETKFKILTVRLRTASKV